MATKGFYRSREAWLQAAVKHLTGGLFKEAGIPVPPVRVSVGWPGGGGNKRNTIGQCWKSTTAEDGVASIFISPVLDDQIDVLGVLVHEMVHAADDCTHGHRGPFREMAVALGLEGKMTATSPGEELRTSLGALAKRLGPFPHSRINTRGYTVKPKDPADPDGPKIIEGPTGPTRNKSLQKVVCDLDGCDAKGYTTRISNKWLDGFGAPSCPRCNVTMTVRP